MAADIGAVVLGGDVGGTKTHLGLYRVERDAMVALRDHLYPTADFKSLEEVVAGFLGKECAIHAACFGVPGPVIAGLSRPVNVPWIMEESALARSLRAPAVRLINDLEATAYGMLHLPEAETAILQRGQLPAGRAPIAVIAAGTGLGEAGLVPVDGGGWRSVATEGGHADFAPRGREQIELLEFLAGEFDHVSFERVLSGPGLVNVYRFLKVSMPGAEPAWLAEELSRPDAAAAAISKAALAGRDARCVRALEIFAAVYGSESANLALKFLALGGVYVGGGIAPKILPMLAGGAFMHCFTNKGRLSPMLAKIPVRVSLNETAALIGAAHRAMEML